MKYFKPILRISDFGRLQKFFVFAFFLLSLGSRAQVEWARQMGGADGDIAASSSADSFGHLFTTGTFSGTSVFGNFTISAVGKGDIFITRTNASNGNVDWVRQIGSANEDSGNSIVCDALGNIYCTGKFSGLVVFGSFTLSATGNSDAFLAKVDPANGNIIWAKKINGSGADGGLAITNDASGNVYTSGYFQGTATFGTFTLNPVGTNFNIFLTKTDGASGTEIWAKGFGSVGYSFGSALSCDAAGDVYLSGNFESEVIFGTNTVTSVQYQDVFVSKHYSSTGNAAWAISSGGSGNDNGNGIVAGNDGYIYTTGKFEGAAAFGTTTLTSAGSADVFVSKRSAANGSLVWVKQFGSGGYEQANAITRDAGGNIFITGQFNGFVNFGSQVLASAGSSDVFMARLDAATGLATWATSMGGPFIDSSYGIITGPNDALYCTGSFQSNVNLLGFSFESKGNTDIFILKLNGATVGLETNLFLKSSVQIMPVPFHNVLNIAVNNKELKLHKIVLTDLSGKNILQIEPQESQEQLDLEFLSKGIYFINLDFENGSTFIKKIVKD